MMTRQERALWAAVIILAAGVLFMGSLVVIRGLEPAAAVHESEEEQGSHEAVASFDGQIITEDEWVKELKRTHGHEMLVQMLNQKAVDAESKVLQIRITPEEFTEKVKADAAGYGSENAYYQAMSAQLGLSHEDVRAEAIYQLTLEKIAIAMVLISDEEVDRYIKQHKDEFEPKKKYELAWIKLKNRKEANNTLDRLGQGEDFGKLAEELSLDEYTRMEGGKLGVVEEDDPFVPGALLDAAKELEAGDIAGPIQLKDDGYAVMQVIDIERPEQPGMDKIHASVRKHLALNEAIPLTQLEAGLREKYGAKLIMKPTS
ncbi:peptidyl-prolyl cis-trans isomerase [Paenibacillus sp.]|jgi:foldase protein PrsA|uniref:peptidyl-prolyl cis-trans isomerase n=1 Tax=Paenibacillus sp. TaxID=58172 RepID=UPI00281B2C67|nr:peptidyl-prolyl cis-trans isomerase [Paenibacillus sp.]MDR0270159.1 peptidyl-prolyl cis-trans isomerase [Paenibacillus sp.]